MKVKAESVPTAWSSIISTLLAGKFTWVLLCQQDDGWLEEGHDYRLKTRDWAGQRVE